MVEQLPTEVQAFLKTHIDSVVALDALLLLRTEPHRPWELADVARVLTIAPPIARRALTDLRLRELVTEIEPMGWIVIEQSAEVSKALRTLEALYQQNRWLIAREVAGSVLGRLRVMATAFTRRAP